MNTLMHITEGSDGSISVRFTENPVSGHFALRVFGGAINSYEYHQDDGWSAVQGNQEFSFELFGIGPTIITEDGGILDPNGGRTEIAGYEFDVVPGLSFRLGNIIDFGPDVDLDIQFNKDLSLAGFELGASVGLAHTSASVSVKVSDIYRGAYPQTHITIQPDGSYMRTTFGFYTEAPGVGARVEYYPPGAEEAAFEGVVDVLESVAAEIAAGFRTLANPECFLAGTAISIWRDEVSAGKNHDKQVDEATDLKNSLWKPIEHIEVGDTVVSYDQEGRLAPGRVVRTMRRRVTQILDFWGTGMTPGHAVLCAEGIFCGQHVPIIDILRTDGAIYRADGTKIRAATGCVVGSDGDQFVYALVASSPGSTMDRNEGIRKIRLGTRIILNEHTDISLMDIVNSHGGKVTPEGYVWIPGANDRDIIEWTLGETLPNPEDYILKRSNTTLADIYAASEWEQIKPRVPWPQNAYKLPADSGHAERNMKAVQPNIPPAFSKHPDSPINNAQGVLQRKIE